MAKIDQRSLYASPFPFKASLDAITEFFQDRAPVNCVRMRRHMESKDFRGSVFVEFSDEASAQKVHARPPTHATAWCPVLASGSNIYITYLRVAYGVTARDHMPRMGVTHHMGKY